MRNLVNIKESLKKLMTEKCQSMNENSRCKKHGGCDGQCPYFCLAITEISDFLDLQK